ncbi:MAG: lysylphosphatidylglycerol synthase domain-containing protein [Mycoplasma sp.]
MSSEKNQSNIFLTKQRMIIFGVSFLVLIGLVIFSMISILKLDFGNLNTSISNMIEKDGITIFYLFLIFAIFPFVRSIQMGVIYFLQLKAMKIHTTFFETFKIALLFILIISITPSAIGGEPFLIYSLRKKGVSLRESSAMVLMNSTVGHFAGTLITFPSFFYILFTTPHLFESQSGQLIFWFSLVGMIMEVIVMISFLILSFSTKFHYYINLTFNWFLKIMKFKHKTKQEISSEVLEKAEFKNILMKHYKKNFIWVYIFLSTFAYNAALYAIMYASIAVVSDISDIPFYLVFNYTNVATTANNFIPLPGSEGSLQVLLNAMLNFNSSLSDQAVKEGIFIWRTGSSYVTSLIGIIIILFMMKNYLIGLKNKKLNTKNFKDEILIISSRAHNTIGGIENYNRQLIDIFQKNNIKVRELKLIPDEFISNDKFLSKSIIKTKGIEIDSKLSKKTKEFDNIENMSTLKQFIVMRNYITSSRKIVKDHLKNNAYSMIVDSSFCGFKFLFENNQYVWVQHNSRKSRNGQIFNNPLLNWIAPIFMKILGVKNTFKESRNVILYDKFNEIDVNIPDKKFFKIPLPYVAERNLPNKQEVQKKQSIAFIGRIEKDQKRVDLLIDVSNHMQHKISVYGTGPMLEDVKKSKNLIYKGKFDNSNLHNVYSDISLLVVLSNHEGYCFSAVEAISNNTPVIVRDTFPSAKLFTQNKNTGLLIDSKMKTNEIARTIEDYYQYVINNQKEVVIACEKLYQETFRYDSFSKSWLNVYNELIKKQDNHA